MIIRSEEIYKKANSIVKSCGTRDTLKIARELGIHLHFLDNLNDLLGMYTYRHKERHILLNSNMEYLIMQMVAVTRSGMIPFIAILPKGTNRSRSSCCSICAQNTNMRRMRLPLT